MENTLSTYHPNKLAKWILTFTLFFSIFTFSGYFHHTPSKQQATQTELFISTNKIGKRIIRFQKNVFFRCTDNFLQSLKTCFSDVLCAYNTWIKIRLNHTQRQQYTFKSTHCFLQVKTIPQSSDEPIFAIS
jgi:hypothetical protein